PQALNGVQAPGRQHKKPEKQTCRKTEGGVPGAKQPEEEGPPPPLPAARLVEKKREPGHALHRSDGERGAGNAVDFAVQAIAPRELRILELLQERGSADFLPPAFAIDEHAHVIDAPVDDDETRGDQLLLADLLQYP